MSVKNLVNKYVLLAATLCIMPTSAVSIAGAQTDLDAAKDLYDEKCASCHGNYGTSLFPNRYGFKSAQELIDSYYPVGAHRSVSGCDDQCIEDTNIYVWEVLWGNASDDSDSSDNDNDSDSSDNDNDSDSSDNDNDSDSSDNDNDSDSSDNDNDSDSSDNDNDSDSSDNDNDSDSSDNDNDSDSSDNDNDSDSSDNDNDSDSSNEYSDDDGENSGCFISNII